MTMKATILLAAVLLGGCVTAKACEASDPQYYQCETARQEAIQRQEDAQRERERQIEEARREAETARQAAENARETCLMETGDYENCGGNK
jgi:ferredoxin